MANKEAGIAQVANINQLPRTDGFTSPPNGADTQLPPHFEGGAEYTHRRKKPAPSGA